MIFYILIALIAAGLVFAFWDDEPGWFLGPLLIGGMLFFFLCMFLATAAAPNDITADQKVSLAKISDDVYVLGTDDNDFMFVYENTDGTLVGRAVSESYVDITFTDDSEKATMTRLHTYYYNPWLVPWRTSSAGTYYEISVPKGSIEETYE